MLLTKEQRTKEVNKTFSQVTKFTCVEILARITGCEICPLAFLSNSLSTAAASAVIPELPFR